MDDWDRFSETTLPPKEAFYSKLNISGVSDQGYEHALRVWRDFGIRNLGEYHDLYLKTDVILLANVFEAFREVCLDNYRLDPAHFYMAPGLAWKACLKKTKIRLELLLDPGMLLMFERGIRRGITQSVHRWAKANNPTWVQTTTLVNQLSSYNTWMPTTYMGEQCLNLCLPEDSAGLTFTQTKLAEVDVAYPRELHNYHNDLPFTCKRMVINGMEKLVTNLY